MKIEDVKPETRNKLDKIKLIGKEIDFDLEFTPQALMIIDSIPNFPTEHFKAWWKKNYAVVNGAAFHKYFSVEDGIHNAKD